MDQAIISLNRKLMRIRVERDNTQQRIGRIVRSQYTVDGLEGVDDVDDGAGSSRSRTRATYKYVRGCAVAECRGFIRTPDYSCGTCQTSVCRHCMEPTTDTHVCDPDAVATTTLLRQDTKACPTCASLIYKIDGCDQMFCTVCHVAFSWRTGVIEQGRVHNPHYYQWRRSQSATMEIEREADDTPCGGDNMNAPRLPYFRDLSLAVRGQLSKIQALIVEDHHRIITHLMYVDLRRLPPPAPNDRTNIDLRLRYLLNSITREQWKNMLVVRERARCRKLEQYQILQMYCTVACDILANIISKNVSPHVALLELTALREYADNANRSVSVRYNCLAKTLPIPQP